MLKQERCRMIWRKGWISFWWSVERVHDKFLLKEWGQKIYQWRERSFTHKKWKKRGGKRTIEEYVAQKKFWQRTVATSWNRNYGKKFLSLMLLWSGNSCFFQQYYLKYMYYACRNVTSNQEVCTFYIRRPFGSNVVHRHRRYVQGKMYMQYLP